MCTLQLHNLALELNCWMSFGAQHGSWMLFPNTVGKWDGAGVRVMGWRGIAWCCDCLPLF